MDSPEEMTDLPLALRERLATIVPPALREVALSEGDGGTTLKWSWALHDGARIETVLMKYPDRATVCVSTQAGCAMNCPFCATGQAGFTRNLSTGEILEQVARAWRALRPARLTNVVFMGMGEPLSNYSRLVESIKRLRDDFHLSPRRQSVSTVGIVPGILRLANEGLPVTLAVSLHAANDELRDRLVPMNKRYPLARLREACEYWVMHTRRRLTFEWAMIQGVNDRPEDAKELAELALPLQAHVNCIPLNPTPGFGLPASPEWKIKVFCDRLASLGVNVTVRSTRGSDAMAACGQLSVATRSLGDPGSEEIASLP
jgi:23S rRNA (adenine2503-C2)-methyltransferase